MNNLSGEKSNISVHGSAEDPLPPPPVNMDEFKAQLLMELDLDNLKNQIALLEQDKLDKSELDLAMHKFMMQTPS